MNTKNIQIFSLSLVVLVGFFFSQSKAFANDPVLDPTIVITDDWVAQSEKFHCGKVEETSQACQATLSACVAGMEKIMDNAYSVCEQHESDCSIIDVTTTHFTQTAYTLLVEAPIHTYANGFEVAAINNCRVQHPLGGDPQPAAVQPTTPEDQAKRAADRRARLIELGELDPDAPPAPAPVNAAPAAEVPAAAAAPAPVVANDQQNAAAEPTVSGEKNAETNAGGCSMQVSTSTSSALQTVFAMLLMALPFAASSTFRRCKIKD